MRHDSQLLNRSAELDQSAQDKAEHLARRKISFNKLKNKRGENINIERHHPSIITPALCESKF